MKNTVKKILAMILVVCLALPMFVMPIFAENGSGTNLTWEYDTDKKVLTYTSQGTKDVSVSVAGALGNVANFKTQVTEVIIKNGNSNKFTSLDTTAFDSWTSLKKVTIPSSVNAFGGVKVFNNATALEEIVVEGEAYIPGAADLRYLTRPNASTTFNTDNHRSFEGTKIKILILPGGYYDGEVKPIKVKPTITYAKSDAFGKYVETVMGPYGDAYLESFAQENGWDYVPYGKIGEGTAWTYDEATKTVTIYGNGTGSVLTANPAEAYPANTTNVIIRSDIISIEKDALASIENLENVIFEGKVPEAADDPFGGKTVEFHKSYMAAASTDGYWADKTVNNYNGEYEGTIPTTSPVATYKNVWEYDVVTKTLTISNPSTNGARLQTGTADLGGWSAYVDKIKTVVLSGRFERISENGFRYHTALETVILNSNSVYGWCNARTVLLRAFAESTKLSTIAMSGHAYIPGVADFSEGSTSTSNSGLNIFNTSDSYNSTFINTAIKGIILPVKAPTLNVKHLPKKLESVIVKYDDANAAIHEEFCKNNNYNFMYYGKLNSNAITWIYDVNTHALSFYGTGALTSLSLPEVVTDVDSLYIDNGITSIDAATFKTLGSFGIDGVENSDKAGVAVRYEDYNGLRNIYDFNNGVSDVLENFGYSLVEFGAILVSSNKLAASGLTEDDLVVDPVTLETNVDGAVKKDVWSNGAWTGKVLSYAEGVETTFAVTLTNYTNNWDSGVYSRAYAVYEDASDNRTVVYADNGGAVSLYDAMVSGCQQGVLAGKVCEDVAVWNVLETGKVADLTVTGATAMVINGKDASADTKVLVVRGADGTVADEATIAAAKNAATAAGYTVDSAVIALAFTSAT